MPRSPSATSSGRKPRVGYYLWRFPALSETFIRRELAALATTGTDVRVIADAPETNGEPGLTFPVRYLHTVPRMGVASGFLRELLRGPARALHPLAWLTRRQYDETKSPIQDLRVWQKAILVGRLVRALGIEHLHAPWGDVTAIVALLAARFAGVPFSVQFRAHDLHRVTSAFLVAEKIREASFVVTNSRFNEQQLLQTAPERDRPRIHVVYEGVAPDKFPTPERRRDPGQPLRVLSVARLIEPKGLVHLFEACSRLRRSGLELRCEVVGGPELPRYAADLAAIERTHRRLALGDSVRLLGPRPFPFVLERYGWAEVFVLPCVVGRDGSRDITPNALIEAMASGLPVVSTSIGAIPELVDHEVSGLLVPPGDVDALVAALQRLAEDATLRAELGRAARQRVAERFNVRQNVAQYARLFGAGH